MTVDIQFDINKLVKITALATVTRPLGSIDLDGYPLLTLAPNQWGLGVRTSDNGTEATAIRAALAMTDDADQVAAHFGTTAEHVRQANDYALAHPIG
jgi:hypothetical protein